MPLRGILHTILTKCHLSEQISSKVLDLYEVSGLRPTNEQVEVLRV